MKLKFDPFPFLETYFRESANPNPSLEDVLAAIDVVRSSLDSPELWSEAEFFASCLNPLEGHLTSEELREAARRALDEALWLRENLPAVKGRGLPGQRRFLEKALAIPELKKFVRTLDGENDPSRVMNDPSRVTRELDRLISVPPLDYGPAASAMIIHQPALILRHVVAHRLLADDLQAQGLNKTLAALEARWQQIGLPRSKELMNEMIQLIRDAYQDQHDFVSVERDGKSYSVLGDLGEILGWLHEGPRGYELRDEWGLPVAFQVRRSERARSELLDEYGLPLG